MSLGENPALHYALQLAVTDRWLSQVKLISWEVGEFHPLFLLEIGQMTHPLVPHILELAAPVAESLGLEVVHAVFQTNQSPPVLRIDVRNINQEDTGLDDCERMSTALDKVLDASEIVPDAYVLEVSSPGVSEQLSRDRDFIVFKGFPVEVVLSEPHRGKREWLGKLNGRDDASVYLNRKGKAIALPRELVQLVQLSNHEE